MPSDKFLTGGTGDVRITQCLTCIHRVEGAYPIRCPAFRGPVPDAILTNEHDHRNPYPGDHGIRYEPNGLG